MIKYVDSNVFGETYLHHVTFEDQKEIQYDAIVKETHYFGDGRIEFDIEWVKDRPNTKWNDHEIIDLFVRYVDS